MKANKKAINSKEIIDKSPMGLVMADDFARYAKAVLSDRALPDVRDGMKPVQRRIIYGMYDMNNTYDKPTVKSATIVGQVMGHFHPHGDSSIYDALVRLSQDWKMEVPLVEMQGNNGSIDNDPAAASRYTEARLQKISSLLVKNIDKNTVDMQLNFADKELEPTVLPCYFPNLLVNGAQGIAVGAVTNIPTHNLNEVIDACIYLIENEDASLKDLRKFIIGPDFPTGGYIDQKEALDKLYETGTSTFYINSTAEIDQKTNSIIITSIPYGVIKSDFVANLDNFRINNNIDNIVDIRDESSEDIRIVMEIKSNQDANAILSFYRKKGLLRTTFAANMLAIDKGHPKTLNLYAILKAYISHQVDVYTRSYTFELNKDNKRLNILNGLIRCVSIIDQVIAIIKASKGKQDSKNNIIKEFGFDEEQAEAIVMLNLYKINNLDYNEFLNEKKIIEANIKRYKKYLSDPKALNEQIVKTLKEIQSEYKYARKTQILNEVNQITEDIDVTKLIAKEETIVVLTKDGYIKRTNMRSYQASISNDISKDLPKLKEEDGIVLNLKCSTHDGLIAFLSTGTYIYIPVYTIPEGKWKEEGKHLNFFIKNLNAEDRVVSAYIINTFDLDTNFILLSKYGKIKRTKLKEFEQKKLTSRPLKAMGLVDDDVLVKVELSSNNDDVLVIQNNGYSSRYNENYIPLVSIKAGGVKAINNLKIDARKLEDRTYCVSFVLINPATINKLLLIGDQYAFKLISTNLIPNNPRCEGSKVELAKVFKSNLVNIIDVVKYSNEKTLNENVLVYSTTETNIIDLSSLKVSDLGSGFKRDDNFLDKGILKGVHKSSYIIDSSFKVGKPMHISSKPTVVKDKTDKQMSLFDLFDQENNS